MVPVSYYFALSAVLFALGAMGVLIRRNAILIFMYIFQKSAFHATLLFARLSKKRLLEGQSQYVFMSRIKRRKQLLFLLILLLCLDYKRQQNTLQLL